MAANEPGAKARIRAQLGPIGDLLAEQGDDGPAAAVRTMAYLLSQYRPSTLLDAANLAASRLRDLDQPEMAQAIEGGMVILEARRPAVGVAIDFTPGTHQAFAAYPGIEDEVRAWINDPNPKVSGLRISLGISAWSELFLNLVVNNDPEPPIQVSQIHKAGQPIVRTLDKCHRQVITRLKKPRTS